MIIIKYIGCYPCTQYILLNINSIFDYCRILKYSIYLLFDLYCRFIQNLFSHYEILQRILCIIQILILFENIIYNYIELSLDDGNCIKLSMDNDKDSKTLIDNGNYCKISMDNDNYIKILMYNDNSSKIKSINFSCELIFTMLIMPKSTFSMTAKHTSNECSIGVT